MLNKNLVNKKGHNPLSPWFNFRDEMMDFFERFGDMTPFNEGKFVPKIEVKDQGNSYLVMAEVPGMSDKDINITLDDKQLILEGEKKEEQRGEEKGVFHSEISYGRFYRTIPLNDDINPEKVSASYKDGVLRVELQKRPEAERRSKRINISSNSPSTKH